MGRQFVLTALLTGTLVSGWTTLGNAQKSPNSGSINVVATVTAIDLRTQQATLKTEDGEVYALTKEKLWKVGDKVLCNRVPTAPNPRLQECRPWK